MKEEKLGKRVALSLVEVKKENTEASVGMSTGASSGTVTLCTTPTVSAYESRIPQQHVDQHLELSRLQHTTSSAGTGYAIHDFLSLYGGTPSRFIDPNSSRTTGAVCTQDFLQPMERANNTENLQIEKLGHGRASGQASVGQTLTPGINNPANDHAGNLAYWSNVQLKFGFPDLMASSRIPLVNAVDASQQPVASVSKQRVQGNRGLGELGKECEKTSEDDEDEDDYHEHSRDTKKQGSTSKGESMQRLNGKFLDEKELTFRSKHSATEQRRRSKINARFQRLRELVPHGDQKRDKASFLLEVIEYIQGLQDKVRIYETTGQVKQQDRLKNIAWDISKMERDKRSGIGELPIEASSACTSVTGNLQLQKMNDAHRVFIMQRGAEPNRSGCTQDDIASNGMQGSQLLKSKLGGINVATSHDDKGAFTNPPLLSASLSLTREGMAQAPTGQDQGNLIMAKRTFTVEENELLSLPEGKDRQTESSAFPRNGGGKGITEQFVADTLLPLAQEESNTPTVRKPEALQSRGDTLEDGTEQEPRSMISGVVSVSAAYSQGLLDTLTRALQGAGLDLSQAKISVRIDLGKSVGAPASLRGVTQSPESSPRSYQSQERLKQSRSSPDSDRPSKKAKAENQ